ncbi:MAG: UDP-N-acetylmuramoyl-tripeptide--D-alanyl-D-alanine ligase [Bacilli bacterium]|nr:UDP-N-acetylmuramoyl-tripeptide--D-alanyl-D-alanine ligase [Bacilli bacterium]
MKIYFIISLIPCLYYLIFKSKKAMHMLQQNWYNDGNRYFKWVIDNERKVFITYDLLFILFALLKFFKFNISAAIFIFFYLCVYYLYKNSIKKEQSKKPLVITARIKRLYFTLLVLYVISIIPIVIGFESSFLYIYYIYIGFIIWLNYLFVMLANIINKPIEKLVFIYYKRKAQKKLNSMINLKRIGITGSYGKTSTKNALNDILNVKYNSFATPKSFNTMYGLMNAINNYMDKFNDIFIAEMGAFKMGEIKEKANFIKPKYAILTTIGTAHLESFGSVENIQKGKFELIDSLPDDGVAVLNMDDPYQVNYKLKSKCKVLWVSMNNKDADLYVSNIKLSNSGTKFTCVFKSTKEKAEFETKLLGNANVYNICESIALAYELGLSVEQIKTGVKKIATIEHRLELKKLGDITIIDDAYNSNPVGSKMAVDVLGLMDGKKIIVTPGMIELGDKQYEYNMEFGRQIAKVCDEVILVGKEQTKPIYDGLKKEKYNEKNIYILNDVKEAFPLMKKLSDKKTYVLLENDLPDIFNE